MKKHTEIKKTSSGKDNGSAISKAVGKKIRALRLARKMSLKELSRETDLTPSSLSQIERGLSNPSLNALRRISKTF